MYYGNPLTYVLYILSVQIYGDNSTEIVYGETASGTPIVLTVSQASHVQSIPRSGLRYS